MKLRDILFALASCAALASAILPSAACGQTETLIVPADHFPGLQLEEAIPARFSSGEEVVLAGELADASLSQVLFSFASQSGGQDVEFSISSVRAGRFARTIVFDHRRTGTYDLVVYAGNRGESLSSLGVYSAIAVTEGSGPVLAPTRFFDGLVLDNPLPSDLPFGIAIPFAGQVADPQIRQFRIEIAGAGAPRVLEVGLEQGRFSRPLRLGPDQTGDLVLSVIAQLSDGGYWEQGAFTIHGIQMPSPHLVVGVLTLSLLPGTEESVPLHNHGDAPLVLGEITVDEPFQVVAAPATVPAGGSSAIRVSYTGSGGDEGMLIATSDDPRAPQTQVALQGLTPAQAIGALRHQRADADGTLRLDLDLAVEEYALALYSAQVCGPDTGATYTFSVGGSTPAARLVPIEPVATPRDLAEATVRQRERTLARRLHLLRLPAAKLAAVDYSPGHRRDFVFDDFGPVPRQVVGSRVVATNARAAAFVHEAWYDPNPSALPVEQIQAMIDQFAADFDLIVSTFGRPSDVDGDGRIAFLFTPLVDAVGLAGFLDPGSVVPIEAGGNGNLTDLLFLSPSEPGPAYRPLLVHEFQHLINYNQHVLTRHGEPEHSWLNEGLSHLSEDLVGGFLDGGNAQLVQAFLADPGSVSLAGDAVMDLGKRGASYLFVRSLVDRLGPGVLLRLVQSGLADRDNVEQASGEPFAQLLAFWATQLYASGTGLTQHARFAYTSPMLQTDGGRGFPMPASLVHRVGDPALSGRLRPRGVNFLQLQGESTSLVELLSDPSAELGVAILTQPLGFIPPVRIPSAYFTDVALDTPLPGEFVTGEPIPVRGRLADTTATQVALQLSPKFGDEALVFQLVATQGEFARTLVLDHTAAGQYDLALFAGQSGERLDMLGEYGPVRVRRGRGVVHLPPGYFNHVLLDAPLKTAWEVGEVLALSGRVQDAAATAILFRLVDEGGEEALRSQLEVSGERFSGPLSAEALAAGGYLLEVYVGDRQLAFVGVSPLIRIAAEAATVVSAERGAHPGEFALHQNFPNPFNGWTAIPFTVPTPGTGGAERVELVIHDLAGQRLTTLTDGPVAAGPHLVHWDGYTDARSRVASGVYLCRLTAGPRVVTRKLVLVR